MDGKNGAQDLLDKVMKDPTLLAALSSAKRNSEQTDQGEADGGTAA
jgi:type VI secretion system protein ImpB